MLFFIIKKFFKKKKMAKEEKSVIEQALLEAEQIDATFKANAKEILTQTMGSEIEEMVKESLSGSRRAINEDEDDDMDTDLDMSGELDLDLDLGDDGAEGELDLDLDLGDDADDMDDETVDLTGIDDDEELIKVFKAMDPESELEVVQDDNGVSFTDNETGTEYKVELGNSVDVLDVELGDDVLDIDPEGGLELGDDVLDVELGDDVLDIELEEGEEEIVYEIEIEEEEEEGDEIEEGSRTLGSGRSHGRKGLNKPKAYKKMSESRKPRSNTKLIKENKLLKNKIDSIELEKKSLKENQDKMVDALKQFRQKLQEVAIFNSNLAHVVRLFTENTTTKEEKVDIVKRMDEATSLKESKLLFKTINKELSGTKSKKTIKESVENKVNKTASTGSKEIISESKVYTHPELEKMKKMWEYNYINK